MIKNYENKKVKINLPLKSFKKGDITNIKVDSSGTPTEKYWRDRFKDSEIDQCVEFVKPSSVKKQDVPENKTLKKEK